MFVFIFIKTLIMASAEHLGLSDFIKSVHQNLRETSKKIGVEQAWQIHCSDEQNLKKYASAMQELACQHWEHKTESSTNSRIQWTVNTCLDYFTNNGINKFRDKEKDISSKIHVEFAVADNCNQQKGIKLKLLDVGSCYNPFHKFELFEVTALDIAPAMREVFKSDFLNVKLGETFVVNNNELCELPRDHFDVVVFSLLLEYFPDAKQRLICCEKTYDLLRSEGLLVVITPDSNHVGINSKYMKSWRYVLAKMGFSRIKYEKLSHVHCMAFRKSVSRAVASRWAELHKNEQLFEEICIPQDFNKAGERCKPSQNAEINACTISENDFINFSELPECDIFE